MKLNLSYINQVFFDHYRLKTPAAINKGWCFRWAYIAHCLYGGKLCSIFDYHAFIKIDDLYYDSETLDGVSDWTELPCLGNLKPGSTYTVHSLEEFLNFWGFIPSARVLTRVKKLISLQGASYSPGEIGLQIGA